MASILKTIAQDLNRSLLHGARKADETGKILPSTMLDGRQAVTTMPQLGKGVTVSLQVDGSTVQTDLVPDASNIGPVDTAVRKALEHPDEYFQLEAEKQLPTWICQQKLFSLPKDPSQENHVLYKEGETGPLMKLLRLPPAVLHENAAHKSSIANPAPAPARISLCRVWQETKGSASYQKLAPLDQSQWQPAILVRCPLNPAWESDSTETPVFELKGVPQDERWYLDKLKLLPPMSDNGFLPQGARLMIWVEKPAQTGQVPEQVPFSEWVMARRNLTVLARPGESALQDDDAQPVPFPFAVTQADMANTIRLLQMGSITNSGGYYFRPYWSGDGQNKPSFAHAKHVLLVAILWPKKSAGSESQDLPLAANAAVFPAEPEKDPSADSKKPEEPSVVRFEGEQHMVVEPYTPMGCVAFGWRRILPKLVTGNPKEELKPSTAVGFSRSIHLLDFEIRKADGTLLEQFREKVTLKEDPTMPSRTRRIIDKNLPPEPCSGDSGPALSPVKRLHGQTDQGSEPLPWVLLDTEPEADPARATDDDPPTPDRYFYRNTIRLAKEENGFRHLADPAFSSLTITAAYRDIFGNRLLPGRGKHQRTLAYADALIPPGEWPGFTFRVFASAAGVVTMEAIFRTPDIAANEKDDVLRKLERIKAQLDGAADDVSVTLVDGSAGDAPFKFAAQGATSLKAGLLELLSKAIAWETAPAPLSLSFALTFTPAAGAGESPCVFAPVIVIERTDPRFYPDFDGLLGAGESFVKEHIRSQVLGCRHALPLAANAFKDDPKPPEDHANPEAPTVTQPSFREVAASFSKHLGEGFKSQAAGRRNRFNEHELWFVPNALFPKVRSADPVFSTPRPLSNTLGAESFEAPDFFGAKTDNWRTLKTKEIGATRVDYDLLGRQAFELVDRLAQPLALTERIFLQDGQGNNTTELLWNAILSGKDQVAQTLGDAGNGLVVPFFKETGVLNKGVTRMCKDAFQRDLRLFYGIDTLVQWPVALPAALQAANQPVTNFYGVSEAVIKTNAAAKPTFSDFVLNPADDLVTTPAGAAAGHGQLTVTYDLPPDGEKKFEDWVTESFTARITHLQLPTGDALESHVFNQGQWLELVPAGNGTAADTVPVLKYAPQDLKIPAVLRRFPKEPVMPSCKALSPDSSTVKPDQLALWGWEVKFEVETDSSDIIYLEVEYSDPEKPAQADLAEDADEWPSKNLLQDLVVLGRLANQPLAWWSDTTTNGAVAMQAFPPLLRALNKHLLAKAQQTLADAPSTTVATDHFNCEIKSLAAGPKVIRDEANPNRKQVVAQIEAPDANSPLPVGISRFSFKAEADGVAANGSLRLFGETSATAFRPNLRLKRNAKIMGREPTPSLVYECGPVYYPELLRAANRFSNAITAATISGDLFGDDDDGKALETAMTTVLTSLLGTSPGSYYDLRVDCKHSFLVGKQRLTNAFLILPTDYKYTTAAALATDLVGRYMTFLGSHPAEVIKSISGGAFVLGLQVISKQTPHPVLLEIDALEFTFTS